MMKPEKEYKEYTSTLEEIKKIQVMIDPKYFREELLQSFKNKLSSSLSRKLAIEEVWINDLLLQGEIVDEVIDQKVEDVIVTLETLVYREPETEYLAVLASDEYEVRIYDSIHLSGMAVISPEFRLEGLLAFDRFLELPVEGEITKIPVKKI